MQFLVSGKDTEASVFKGGCLHDFEQKYTTSLQERRLTSKPFQELRKTRSFGRGFNHDWTRIAVEFKQIGLSFPEMDLITFHEVPVLWHLSGRRRYYPFL